jgi:iron complex outermembrane recepter protein
MAADDANTVYAPGFVSLAASASYSMRLNFAAGTARSPELAPRIRFYLRGDNLADRRIVGSVIVNDANGRFFEPALPRRVTIGINGAWTF